MAVGGDFHDLASTRPPSPIRVFISYSHDSPEHAAHIKRLADSIGSEPDIDCVIDQYVPGGHPPEKWPRWMTRQLGHATKVICVCSERYERLWRGENLPPTVGRGVHWEAENVINTLYGAKSNSRTFKAMVARGATESTVPGELKDWGWLTFPRSRDSAEYRELCSFLRDSAPSPGPGLDGEGEVLPYQASGGRPRAGAAPAETRPGTPSAQAQWANKCLLKPGAAPFLEAVSSELFGRHNLDASAAAAEIVARYTEPGEQDAVLELFHTVRRALLEIGVPDAIQQRDAVRHAAVSLYFLAACQLVDPAARGDHLAIDGCDYLLKFARSDTLIVGLITTALFGGQLHFVNDAAGDDPQPECVFLLPVQEVDDQVELTLERMLYNALFRGNRGETGQRIASGRLSDREKSQLAARLRTLKSVRLRSVGLVVRGVGNPNLARELAEQYQVPVVLESREVSTALIGMDVEDLLQEMHEFWEELQDFSEGPKATREREARDEQQGGTGVTKSTTINITGPVTGLKVDDHSLTQTGNKNRGAATHQEGADLAALLSLVTQLANAIQQLPEPGKAALEPHLQTAMAEADKPKPERSRLKTAIDVIKGLGDTLDGGGKIVEACHKIYEWLGSMPGGGL